MIKEWFINQRRMENFQPSEAEKRINKILTDLGYYFEQEISFSNCRNSKNSYLIFDFIIPKLRVLIEYDGKHHETNYSTIEHDLIKNKFAKDYGYRLLRFNKANWMTLEANIKKALKNVKKPKPTIQYPKLQNEVSLHRRTKKQLYKKAISKIRVTIEDYNRFYPN